MTLRSILAWGLVCFFAAPALTSAQQPTASATGVPARSITIATGTKGAAYNLIGLELAKQIKEFCGDCDLKVLETAGGIENMNLLREGKADIVFVNASAAWEAFIGINQFKGKAVPLRALAALYPNSMHLVVRSEAKIKTLTDLRGKRVATGAPGSGTEVISNQMLRAVGINPDKDIQRSRLGLIEAVKGIREGQLDAFLFGAAVPVKPIAELLKDVSIELISSADAINGMNRIYRNLYREGSIPANTYPLQDQEVKSLDVWDLIAVSDEMPGKLAYEITKRLFENKERFMAAHANMHHLLLRKQDVQTTVSFHLGAQRYYAINGLQPYARQLGYALALPATGSLPNFKNER